MKNPIRTTQYTILIALLCLTLSQGVCLGAPYTLSITANHGSVRVNPDKAYYDEGEKVELIPKPDTGYCFASWAGDAQEKRLVLNLTMDSDKDIIANFETWKPPIGIPMPEFGIFETYRMYDDQAKRNPSLTYTQNAEGGFYTHYIDNTHSNATDTSNPYGTTNRPRNTIPLNLAAGSVVEVHGGPYTYNQGGSVFITGYASSENPIFVRGVANENFPYFATVKLRVEGTYLIVEYLASVGGNVMGELGGGRDTHHVAIRNSDFYSLSMGGGGMFVGAYDTSGARADYVVFYNNSVHDHGDVNASSDQDYGGVSVQWRSSNVWIVDNEVYNASSSGIVMNPHPQSNIIPGQTPERIYIGRNHVYRVRQSGIWVKTGQDIIFSENTIHDIINTAWSPSKGMGFQHAPKDVWYLFNEVYDTSMGFGGHSTYDEDFSIYVIGNLIHDLTLPEGDEFNPDNVYSRAAILWWGARHRYIIGNTIYNVSAGIHGPGMDGEYIIANNIIADTTRYNGKHVFIDFGSAADVSLLQNNLFYQPEGSVTVEWGPVVTGDMDELRAQTSTGEGCIVGDPQFSDPSGSDFHLQSTSSAIDAGTSSGVVQQVFDRFQQLYGIDIRKDIEGRTRPQGSAWDIGAYEYSPDSGTFLYGDVSGDSEISAYDAALTAQAAVDLITLTAEQSKAAEVSGDGEVSAYDAALIAQKAVGLIDKFPVEQ